MEPFLAIMAVAFLCCLAFEAGKWAKENPDEEEMIRRLKELRYQRKLKAQAGAEVETILKD